MTNYPNSNTAAAWYQDDYPGATMKPTRVVLHTTEGRTLPGYEGGATAPTYTAVPDFAAKRLKWYAHFPDEKSARALRNLKGGVETNTHGAIQVELVGTCDPSAHASWGSKPHIFWPNPPDWAIADLAAFVAWVAKTHGIPTTGVGETVWTPYPKSYGTQAGQRMTNHAWETFRGWCGHQHVPENVHGDPGALPWSRIKSAAKAILDGTVKPSPKWDALYVAADDLIKVTPAGAKYAARLAFLKTVRTYAANRSTRY